MLKKWILYKIKYEIYPAYSSNKQIFKVRKHDFDSYCKVKTSNIKLILNIIKNNLIRVLNLEHNLCRIKDLQTGTIIRSLGYGRQFYQQRYIGSRVSFLIFFMWTYYLK